MSKGASWAPGLLALCKKGPLSRPWMQQHLLVGKKMPLLSMSHLNAESPELEHSILCWKNFISSNGLKILIIHIGILSAPASHIPGLLDPLLFQLLNYPEVYFGEYVLFVLFFSYINERDSCTLHDLENRAEGSCLYINQLNPIASLYWLKH